MNYRKGTTWGIARVQTSATGANFVQMPTNNADEITVSHPTIGIDVSSGNPGTANFVSLAAGVILKIKVAGNTNEVWVRRTDGSATQVFIGSMWKLLEGSPSTG
jgi:transketolase N-terminal domain/subunit